MHGTKSSNLPKVLFRLLSTLDWDPHLTVLFFLLIARSSRKQTALVEQLLSMSISNSKVIRMFPGIEPDFFVRNSNFGGTELAIDN